MTYEEYSALAMDVSDRICYIADLDTHDLLYINRNGQKLFGLPDGSPQGKCYQILHGRDSVCPFCTNGFLSPGRFYTWEFYNRKLSRHLSIRDTLIEHKGKKLRLELCVDITDRKREEMKLNSRLSLEKTLTHCIYTLAGEKNDRHALEGLLSIVGAYYNAQRVYLFEFHEAKGTMDNICEWCRAGVPREIDKLQGVPLHYAARWIKRFETDGIIVINPLKDGRAWNFMAYQDAEQQGIHTLMAVPLLAGKKIIGFLGVDNPVANVEATSLLRALPFFVQDHLEKLRLLSNLEDMSYVDKLTGLYNRNKYMVALEALKDEPSSPVGILFADINGLKAANDTYSHEFGDGLIKRAAGILHELFPSDVFRIGGDEFVVLSRGATRQVFEEKVKELYRLKKNEPDLSLAVGSAWSEDSRDIARLRAEAEELMYQEKERHHLARRSNMQEYCADRAMALQKDITSGCFVAYLQPQISLRDGKLIGAEALVRRKDADGNLIFPSRLVRSYERHGIVRHLDLFVLETACAYLAQFKQKGCSLPISVNLSHVTLREDQIVEIIKKLCAKYGVSPSSLCLEVTELIKNIGENQLEDLVLRLRGEGFSISLSNFGSEFSSLALVGIDFSEIKLAKTLLRQISKFSDQRTIERLFDICRLVNHAKILAEGIESEEQKNLLIEHQCLYGQGYLFSRAIPVDDFLQMYDEHNKSSRIILTPQKN